MRRRKIVLVAALLVVGLPVALMLIAVASITVLDRTTGTIVSSGNEREYLLHVPARYDASRPAALVIAMHAGATWPAQMKNLTGWSRLGCAADALESSVAVDVVRRQYSGCSSDADVVLYTIDGGGHTWPGGKRLPEWRVGPTSGSVDATRRMWEFFREHPLRSPPGSE